MFYHTMKSILLITALQFFYAYNLHAQKNDPTQYVNTFIGTTKSDVFTKWGNEGGTYPGAVAPSGLIQLSPETRVTDTKGYDYNDSSIYFFSCLQHSSGYPSGSSGSLFIMPVHDTVQNFQYDKCYRKFSHHNEHAQPGFYSVLFTDNNTFVEATSSVHAGMFRFTFPAHVVPKIFIGDAGKIIPFSKNSLHTSQHHAAINFSEDYSGIQQTNGGNIFTFSPASVPVIILVKISASSVSTESAQKNIEAEITNNDFDALKEKARQDWIKELSVVEIEDSSVKNKTIFYTALYHSLLLPYIISDVDGNYCGADKLIHHTNGKNEYGQFSPWDTFRSLHPLLCLLYPEKQADMILSVIDIFNQSGYLPTGPMTGNHIIPVIVDSYLKEIKGIDSALAYTAMKKSIMTGPFIQNDMASYNKKGYISFLYPESVTKTIEYAYDDWALSQFAKLVMHNKDDYNYLLKKSFGYRNLFNADELFLLPRNENEFKLQPGNSGYKEGDKWVYSYFVPHNQKDLINLMGGDKLFSERLDSALTNQQIIFDNEPVFHLPYLFNEANHNYLTQKWVRKIIDNRFNNSPGGLPGNDDLGSTSSWYVLSAMGIFPVCPGRPDYTIGSPIFNSLIIHLDNEKNFIIKSNSTAENIYVKSLSVNHEFYSQSWITHSLIIQGGEMVFDMSSSQSNNWPATNTNYIFSETKNEPKFQFLQYSVSKKKVEPDEMVWVYFSLKNTGATGTKQVKLFINNIEYDHKNCLVETGATIKDSISCRLYALGKSKIKIEGLNDTEVEIVQHKQPFTNEPEISNLITKSITRLGEKQQISFSLKNTGGLKKIFYLPEILNNLLITTDTITLSPGEQKNITQQIQIDKPGFQTITVDKTSQRFKVFQFNRDAAILDLSIDKNIKGDIIEDRSGFGNNAKIISTNNYTIHDDSLLLGKNCFIEIPNSKSLDFLGETITMMLWVYPTGEDFGLVDIFTKGDNHVLQVLGNKTLTFFAGGWGRGDCTVDLPATWKNHWHHIAGVCDGKNLMIYIDGNLKGTTKLETSVNLSVANKWIIGRNEEFPLQRIFNGYADKIKIFTEPLSKEDIISIMKE
jgi:putative alpha-1,2-mannosidase